MGEIVKSILAGLLRYALAGVFGWMIQRGMVTEDQAGLLVSGLAGALFLVGYMAWKKIRARVELLTALTAQPGTSVNDLKDQIKTGVAVPAATPNDATPRVVVDSGSVKPRIGAWLLPLLLASGVVASACAGTIRPPVITADDQAQVRQVATKALAGIEIAGIVVRDSRQLVSDLARAGIVTIEVRSTVNAVVIRSNETVQRAITEIAAATREVTVQSLTKQAADAMGELASLLERQTDSRVQMAGKFLRSAIAAVVAMVGVTL